MSGLPDCQLQRIEPDLLPHWRAVPGNWAGWPVSCYLTQTSIWYQLQMGVTGTTPSWPYDPWVPLQHSRWTYRDLLLYCSFHNSPAHTLPGTFYYQADQKFTTLDGNTVTSGSWEALDVSPGCQIQWVQYTAGNDIPKRSVVGGHLASGTALIPML